MNWTKNLLPWAVMTANILGDDVMLSMVIEQAKSDAATDPAGDDYI